LIRPENLVELGEAIQNKRLRRRIEPDITIADLTGVAVQDIAIAELALVRLQQLHERQDCNFDIRRNGRAAFSVNISEQKSPAP
jgi:ornithine cyclodeaminase/alanine dehydrogenase-like protein (mu-crystallin family)